MALAAALLISALLAGCGYDTAFRQMTQPLAMSIAVTYGDGKSEVVVRYSVPPPRPGRVYVMWAYTKGRAQIAKLGEVPAGVQRTVKGSANFPIQGVTISEEDSPTVTQPGPNGVIEQNIADENLGPVSGRGGNQPPPKKTP